MSETLTPSTVSGPSASGAPSPGSSAEPSAAASIRILIVDNDPAHAQAMFESLERVGYQCRLATSGPEGVRRVEEETYDVVITDLVMPESDGMEVLARARQALPDCEVVMVTGHGTVPKAVEAMQQGAFSFLEKPITPNRLRAVTERAADAVRLRRQNLELVQRLDERFGFEGIIYASARMKAVIERLKRIAPTDATVLITGESGTGKELIAQALHQNSPRKKKPFVALNTGAIAEHLIESELFGHVKGSFTDALSDRVGKFEYANGGTIFLDEVGDMPMATQIKLLRVLETREITRVGDNKSVKVNVRVLSATNRSLDDAIARGEFRTDLLFRLKVVTIDLPPLRDRREDIVPLADSFRRRFAKENGKVIRGLTPAVVRRFFDHPWKGNIRELLNVVQSMVVIDADGVLDLDDLPPDFTGNDVFSVPLVPPPAAVPEPPALLPPAATLSTAALSTAALPAASPPAAAVTASVPSEILASEMPQHLVGRPLDEIERWAIEETLKLTNGNREETARILGIGARTLYRRLEQYEKEGRPL